MQKISADSKPAAKAARAYRGASNEERTAERRGRLLAAAIACFGSHGYHRTTLKMLCAEAGLTERYFYQSFANFDDLLCQAYLKAADDMERQVRVAIERAEPTPGARMLAALDAYFSAVAADKARARLVLIEIEGASEQANATYRRQLDGSTAIVEHAIFSTLPVKPDNGLSPHLLSSAILGAVYQSAKNWVHSGFKPARATVVRNLHALAMATAAAWTAPATKGNHT